MQEAQEEDLVSQLDANRWSCILEHQQFVGARRPSTVESHGGEDTPGRIRWHMATVRFDPPRVNRDTLGVLSLHLNNIHAKKPKAGYQEVGTTIDKACDLARVDVVCGDLNMARWIKKAPGMSEEDAASWHEGTLGELTDRGFIPVADFADECCFVAVHDNIAQTLHIKGSSWGERSRRLPEDKVGEFHA